MRVSRPDVSTCPPWFRHVFVMCPAASGASVVVHPPEPYIPDRSPPVAQPEVSHHDVVIVGARCAGTASARLLAERGHDVVVA